MSDVQQILKEIDSVLHDVREDTKNTIETQWGTMVEAAAGSSALSSVTAAIHRYAPSMTPYAGQLTRMETVDHEYAIKLGCGILSSIRRDYEGGRTKQVAEALRAEVFSDYLEMATYLLEEGFKLAAVVLGGCTLETQLRALATKASIEISDGESKPKKANLVVEDLRKREILSKAEEKQVKAWLDLRNEAAHGHDTFAVAQASLLIDGVRDFVTRHPA